MSSRIKTKNGIEMCPKEVMEIGSKLIETGYKAYLVGGCVRDMIIKRIPKDWDIATDAHPQEIQKVFPDSVYDNDLGTVLVKVTCSDGSREAIEVTTFRREGRYTDKRRPDNVTFSKTIREDLSRRDFTVNALAINMENVESKMRQGKNEDKSMSHVALPMSLVDPYGGREDLAKKIIRTVGNPDERFGEDALRLMRAVRFSAELGFEIEPQTAAAVEKHAGLLEAISKERIRDEFEKIIMSDRPMMGLELLEQFGLLKHIMPEIRDGIGVGQNKHHIYSVWEHNLRALQYTADRKYSFLVRLASLLHDVGKPRSKTGEGPDCHFYGHEHIGAKMVLKILDRLRFSRDFIEAVAHLVRYHLFYYNVGEVTAAGVRRFLARVGPENIDDLMKVREADRIGSGVPKAVPYKLRHLQFMIEKVKRDPISPKMLAVNGLDVMKEADLKPGPKVGYIISILLEEVLDDPAKNTRDCLIPKIKELSLRDEPELLARSRKSLEKKEEFESAAEEEIKKQYYVK